jgi:hypothetical protein
MSFSDGIWVDIHIILLVLRKDKSSVETLSRYRLGTSGNIRIIKGALKKRDLIEETGHQVEIQDPLFKQWIRRIYKKL